MYRRSAYYSAAVQVQIWGNRAFCGKVVKFCTCVPYMIMNKLRCSAKSDFRCGCHGNHLTKCPP